MAPFKGPEPSSSHGTKLPSSLAKEQSMNQAAGPEDQCFDYSAAWFNHPQNYGPSNTTQRIPIPESAADPTALPTENLGLTLGLSDDSSASVAEVESPSETLRCSYCGSLNASKCLIIQNHFSHCYFDTRSTYERVETKSSGSTERPLVNSPGFAIGQVPQTQHRFSEPNLDVADGNHGNLRHEYMHDKLVADDRFRRRTLESDERKQYRYARIAEKQLYFGNARVSPALVEQLRKISQQSPTFLEEKSGSDADDELSSQ